MKTPQPLPETCLHRILVRREVVSDAIERLRANGITAMATCHDIGRDLTCIDWLGSDKAVDLDFLRPDILPPKETP